MSQQPYYFEFILQLKEMKFHGVDMAGPAFDLQKAGASGRHKSNMQRDMLRKVSKVVHPSIEKGT